MTHAIRSSLVVLAILLGAGCASLPPAQDGDTPTGYREIRNQPHYRVAVLNSDAAWPLPPLFRLPVATLVDGATGPDITPAQAKVVANHAARSVCLALAPWMQWTTADEGGRVVVDVQRIASSSSGLAATSAVIDAVDDTFPAINGGDGGTTTSVLVNDTLNGVAADPAAVAAAEQAQETEPTTA